MASSSSTSPDSLGWYYIIETLADSKAELPLLKELINRVPDFYTNAPEQVQERVALRYLEELASRGIVGTKDNTSGTTEIPQSSVEFLCQNLTWLKESVSGANAKLHSTRENGSSSSHRQEDNIVDKEQEMITSPRSAGTAGATHNDASQNLPSQNALNTDKIATEPLQENNPTTVIGNVSDLEAARSEPLSDDIDQFILKRRDAVSKTSVEEPKEPIPETSIPIEPSSNENNNNLRSNADFLDDQSDYERFMGSPIPFSEQNQCIVCNKGGQLLTCSRKGCGITVHESCIMTTPSSFDKEGRFYCPCCACARAKKVFSLARKSLSSFLKMKENQNQEKGERGKQKVEKNITGKREGKKVVSSDDDTAEGENGDATFVGSGDASSSSESDSGDSRRRVDKNGKRKEKRVKSNGRNASEDRDMLCKRREDAKKREADSGYSQLDKYMYVKSGPGATSGSPAAVPMNEETGNERREDKINADANRKRHRPTPRYSNKVVAPRRRNMLPWSVEEEKALREGMQKVGVTADGRIPWSAILDCHRNVFHKTRLPIDLKDKWRNIMKKEGS
ncbi:uncharacterized protein LOC144551690 isoform X2 [Carex rostrata]